WRPAAAARNRSPREARDPALQALRPGCEELAVSDPARMPVREARPRSPKPPRWSAERRASRVMGRKAPRKRLACRVMCRPHGCFGGDGRLAGSPPPREAGGGKAKCKAAAARARGEREVRGCWPSGEGNDRTVSATSRELGRRYFVIAGLDPAIHRLRKN